MQSVGQSVHHFGSDLNITLNYWMDCHGGGILLSLKSPDFTSGTSMRFTFVVCGEISQQLLDRSPQRDIRVPFRVIL